MPINPSQSCVPLQPDGNPNLALDHHPVVFLPSHPDGNSHQLLNFLELPDHNIPPTQPDHTKTQLFSFPDLPLQLDGNQTILSSDSNDSIPHSPLLPLLQSTPASVGQTSSPTSSSPKLPGLLDSLATSSNQSASLENLSNIELYLPFALTPRPVASVDYVTPHSMDTPTSLENLSDLNNYIPHVPTPPSYPMDNLTSISSADPADTCSPHPEYNSSQSPHTIPVLIGVAAQANLYQSRSPRPPQRTRIRRDNRAITALSLPNIMVANHRSFFPKFNNIVDEIIETNTHLGLHCEVWENSENPNHANMIEEALEIHGIKYISTPRPNRRGGGVAITMIMDSPFTLSKLDPPVTPDVLEVCWGLVKHKHPSGHIKNVIVCVFYSPPSSKKKSALINHISLNYYILKGQYPDSAFICGGDKNDLNVQLLLDISSSFRQLVTLPTYRQSVLDVLVTDLGQYYLVPEIRPPVLPDNPALAVPSDHSIVLVKTIPTLCQPVKRVVHTRTVRPLPQSAVAAFGNWIQHEPWTFVYDGINVSDMVSRFNFLIQLRLDIHCPTKSIKISNLDGKFCSAAVRQACRRKNREYAKNGNSQRYKMLKKEVKNKIRDETKKFLAKQVEHTTVNNNSWMKHVKMLTARPGDTQQSTFQLPNHIDLNLSAEESANRICKYFSRISQEYTPLCVGTLADHVQAKLHHDPCVHPSLRDHIVYDALKKGKKTCSVPGDIPVKILDEFLPELTAPIAAIFRESIATHTWPDAYKKEFHLPINKIPQPQSEDDLRNLGLTPFISKRLEWFLIKWIWPYVEPHLDHDQLGGLPGCSVDHYLVLMLDFITKNIDKSCKEPTAVLAALVDFSKAFNRIDHNVIITILADLNVPTCALRLIVSYLSRRRMCVRYNGAESTEQSIPGGGPQGGLLTVILFNLQVNLAGDPCPVPTLLPVGYAGPEPRPEHAGPLPLCHVKGKTMKKKYVDDLSLLESINLKTSLIPSAPIIGPCNWQEQPGLHLPEEHSVLQHQLADLLKFTTENKMKLNFKKTKILSFNLSTKYDFLPRLFFPNTEPLEVIYETRLLGVILASDLSWSPHVNDITKRATSKLWILVRFKSLGASQNQLLKVYQTRIRSTLEFASPVFTSGLAKEQSMKIESIQKKAFALILGKDYCNYEVALQTKNALIFVELSWHTSLHSSVSNPRDTLSCSH